jgi:hypothetical protein
MGGSLPDLPTPQYGVLSTVYSVLGTVQEVDCAVCTVGMGGSLPDLPTPQYGVLSTVYSVLCTVQEVDCTL